MKAASSKLSSESYFCSTFFSESTFLSSLELEVEELDELDELDFCSAEDSIDLSSLESDLISLRLSSESDHLSLMTVSFTVYFSRRCLKNFFTFGSKGLLKDL